MSGQGLICQSNAIFIQSVRFSHDGGGDGLEKAVTDWKASSIQPPQGAVMAMTAYSLATRMSPLGLAAMPEGE